MHVHIYTLHAMRMMPAFACLLHTEASINQQTDADYGCVHRILQPRCSTAIGHAFINGCSTALEKPARCMRGSSRRRLRSTARLTSSGTVFPGAATRRVSAGSSRCNCSSSATPSACRVTRSRREHVQTEGEEGVQFRSKREGWVWG